MDGIELIRRHPLFGRLDLDTFPRKKSFMGNAAARVTESGYIFLNLELDRTPAEWAHIIAHCQLHLAFGHFDEERMPGFFDERDDKKWVVSCDFPLWNMACDIFICKFLADIKMGEPFVDASELAGFGTGDERKIYDKLIRENITAADNHFGTAERGSCDMERQERRHYGFYDKDRFTRQFAFALADSVRTVIDSAGGADVSGRPKTVQQKAAAWFVDHYPLLGGIATGFKIVDTRENGVHVNDVSIAAVNVVDGEIYVNQAAGLSFEEWKFVLAHEYLHAGLQHHSRRQGRDHELWNVACDFVINDWLREMHIGDMPSRGLLYDETLKGKSAEEIYDLLVVTLRQRSRGAKASKYETFRGVGTGDIIDDGYAGDRGSPTTLDEFCRNALRAGLEYHETTGRGFIPAGLIEEIKALSVPPIPWDVQLAEWFDLYFAPLERHRTYARPSRRQSSTPDIPRPSLVPADIPENSRTYGVIIDTSGSMSPKLLGMALGAAASYSVAKEVPLVRVVFCDADAYDIGYVSPDDIAGRVAVKGRGGTVLQPAVDLLENAKDFPKNAPLLIITDGYIEDDLTVKREHAFLIPDGSRLPFRAKGKVFYFK